MLTPGRYVGLPDDEDDFDFNERFSKLTAELKEQMLEGERLNVQVPENLSKVIIPDKNKNRQIILRSHIVPLILLQG